MKVSMRELDPWKLALGGTTLIEASAGTGKTYTLTTLYLRLLVEEDLLPSQILVVTYTNAATAELRERVRTRIREAIEAGEDDPARGGEPDPELRRLALAAKAVAASRGGLDPLHRALQDFDEAAIFTIHGFCQRTLQQNAFESGMAFDAELIEASELLEQTLARDLWARGLAGEHPAFVAWLLEGPGRSRWRYAPDSLKREILGALGADEEMPVLPELDPLEDRAADAEADGDALRAASRRARLEWAEVWQAQRAAVIPWLIEGPALHRGSYKPQSVAEAWIPRLDAWSEAILREPESGEATDFDLPDWWPKLTTDGLAAGIKKGQGLLENPVFDAFAAVAHSTAELDAYYAARALAMRRRFVLQAREEARRRREERHRLVFDDLLSALRAALRGREGAGLVDALRQRYRFALIDEFQDTDPVQYEIFRGVWHRDRHRSAEGGEQSAVSSPRGGLILIGDPKQAIYSFRGADVFTYLAARGDAGESTFGLAVNWRSDPGLIGAVNALFGRPHQAFGIDDIEFHPVRPRSDARTELESSDRSRAGLRVLLAAREGLAVDKQGELPLRFGRTDLMDALARDIADLLDSDARIGERPVAPSDLAILCQTRAELARSRRALEALGIPCVDRGDADVFESREAWELSCVLRAMLRPGDPTRVRAALATGAMGRDALALSRLDDESPALADLSERFAEYGRIWSQSGFMRAFESWRRQEGVTSRLLALIDGERRLTNWLHLAELLQQVATDLSCSRSGLSSWLDRAIADPDVRRLVGSEASLLRLERDEDAVSLVTLHRSKGLQYEIVYLPCLWEDAARQTSLEEPRPGQARYLPPVRCHDPERGQRILDLGSADHATHVSRQNEEALSEQIRLLYVGLTRARRQCVVLWGAIGSKYAATPLAGLLRGVEESTTTAPARSALVKERRALDDDQWLALWLALGEAGGEGAVSIESADGRPRPRWQAPGVPAPALDLPRRDRPIPAARVTTSFSGLVRSAHRSLGIALGPVVVGRDLDAGLSSAESLGARLESGSLPSDLAAGMDSFPRGAEAGTLLHEVLEQVDLSRWQEARWQEASGRDASGPDDEVRALAIEALERNALDPAHTDQILHVVRSVARTPLREIPVPFRLADLAPGQLRPEMEFTLAAPGEERGDGFSALALADRLGKAAPGSPLGRYAERASRLSWPTLRGYLRGFIDAVFFDGERYFLIDYKSNHLGSRQADYGPEPLIASMIEHDYVLQYLLYSIALDRHLSRTLAGYDYDTHFGGAYYLFLRGMAESHAPGCGIFQDRPERDVLRSVSALLGAGRRGSA